MITSKVFRNRYVLVYVTIFSLFAVTYYRLFSLQVIKPERLVELAEKQHNIRVVLSPRRGYIVDHNGNELATSLKVPSVYAVSRMIYKKDECAKKLADVLGKSVSEILMKLEKDKSFVWIARNISEEQAEKIRELKDVNINILQENRRFYPHNELASHVIGFCDIDNKGLAGLEVTLDKFLAGRSGYQVTQRDARGRRLVAKEEAYVPPVHGHNVKLTIDKYIQHIVEKELDTAYNKWNAKGAIAIVMDCNDGRILGMANRPTFNLNEYYKSEDNVRRNRGITDCYEPGSVFKIVTAVAALQEKAFSLDDKIFCENGEYTFRRGRVLHDAHKYGKLDFTSVITKSSNIGTVKIAEKLGEQKLFYYINQFGFGKLTGIDLPGEICGIVRPPEKWSKISISSVPMGQEVAVTPLQLVSAVSAIANEGDLVTPYVVDAIYDNKGVVIKQNKPFVKYKFIEPEVAEEMRSILQKVVEEGTGKNALIDDIPVAGKTGTAQKSILGGRGYSSSDYMSSFLGFVPADKPLLSIIVVLDSPHPAYYGGTVSAPVFKKIAEQTLNYLGYTRDADYKN